MKKYLIILTTLISISVSAQFKDTGFETEKPENGIIDNSSNSILGFINPANFTMRHSLGLSYSTMGSYGGTSIATYTNSMMYKFSDNMNLQLDASIVASPYSSFGTDYQNAIQGIYISRAALNYKPWDDVFISIQYRNMPNYYYDPFNRYGSYGSSYYDGFFGSGFSPFMQ